MYVTLGKKKKIFQVFFALLNVLQPVYLETFSSHRISQLEEELQATSRKTSAAKKGHSI